jgi:ribosomal protein S27AE
VPLHPRDFTRTCPHCGTRAAFSQQQDFQAVDENGVGRRWRAATCPSCGGAILLETDDTDSLKAVLPERVGNWSVLHLPGAVERDWIEAIKVFDVAAYQSTVVACGRTLEAAADELGVEANTLDRRIRKMLEDGLITVGFGDAMTYVRLIRNTGAHAGETVSPESAEGTMRFTLQALRLLYEVPGELKRLRGGPIEVTGTAQVAGGGDVTVGGHAAESPTTSLDEPA